MPALSQFRRTPAARSAPWAVLVLLCVLFAFQADSYNLLLGTTVLVYVMASLGQDWLIGRAGQVSLGGAALLAVGAFATALTANTPLDNFPIPIILSGLVGAAVGVIVGLPALRLIGLYLLLSTLALQFVVQFAARRYERTHPAGFITPKLHIGSLYITSQQALFLIVLGFVVVIAVFLQNIYRRAPGKIWLSLKESELATATMGISLTRWKLAAFVGSSAITAMAGGFLAYVDLLVSSATFSLNLALSLIVMVYVGGQGTIVGPIIGATLVTLLPQGLQKLSQNLDAGSAVSRWIGQNAALLDNMIYGLALLVVLLLERGGLVALARRLGVWSIRQLRPLRSARATVPSTPSPDAVPVAASGVVETVPGTATATAVPAGPGPAAARSGGAGELLRVEGLTVRYRNGAIGVHDLSFAVPEGSIFGLVGRNGAGKTSTIAAIAGFARSERVTVEGSILFDGHQLAGLRSAAVSKLGVALVQERDKVFPSLSVSDHLRAAGLTRGQIGPFLDRFAPLASRAGSPAGLLSGGQRQLLALAMCLARRPKLLLVDEMSLGLAPIAVKALLTELRQIREEHGVTILLVDQATAAVSELADYIYVVENGEIAMHGAADQLAEADVRDAIIGSGVR